MLSLRGNCILDLKRCCPERVCLFCSSAPLMQVPPALREAALLPGLTEQERSAPYLHQTPADVTQHGEDILSGHHPWGQIPSSVQPQSPRRPHRLLVPWIALAWAFRASLWLLASRACTLLSLLASQWLTLEKGFSECPLSPPQHVVCISLCLGRNQTSSFLFPMFTPHLFSRSHRFQYPLNPKPGTWPTPHPPLRGGHVQKPCVHTSPELCGTPPRPSGNAAGSQASHLPPSCWPSLCLGTAPLTLLAH